MTYKREWIHSLFFEVANCSVSISKTITKKEWKKVYREIRPLTKKLDFAYLGRFNFEGVEGQCILRAAEGFREWLGMIYDDLTVLKIEGLYSQRLLVGPVYINKNLLDNWCEQKEGDAFLGYAHSDDSLSIIMLGDELQNTTYIINVLAIAFLIEARLPEKAFVYGPFPYDYAVEAVNKINKYLKEPIGLPVVSRAKDLMNLTQKTNFSDKEKCEFFYKTYMGKYDEECWKILHENFSNEIISEFYTDMNADVDSVDEKAQDIQEDASNDDKESETKQDENENQYDIELTTQLFNYKKGNSINPDLLKDIIKILDDLESAKEQNGYKRLSEDPPLDQIRKIARHLERNDYNFPLLDKDWKHIIRIFKTKKNALERYYPLFMAKCGSYEITSNIIRAFMVNDALYKYCVSKQKENKNQIKEITQEDL